MFKITGLIGIAIASIALIPTYAVMVNIMPKIKQARKTSSVIGAISL